MCAPSVDLRRRMEEDIYLGIFFIRALLLGFYIFEIARRLYRRIHDIGPAPEPDGESRDAPPGARGGVEPGTGYISRSPPRYQENGQLTRGVYRYPTRTTCRVEARRTPHACAGAAERRRRTSYTTQASRLTVLAQHASFNPPFPATSPHETERSSSLVGDGVYMED